MAADRHSALLRALVQVARATSDAESVVLPPASRVQQLMRAGWVRTGTKLREDIARGVTPLPWHAVTPAGLDELRSFDPEAAALVDRARELGVVPVRARAWPFRAPSRCRCLKLGKGLRGRGLRGKEAELLLHLIVGVCDGEG